MQYTPVVLLVFGYLVILAVFFLLVRNWITAKDDTRGPRFILIRNLNIAVISLCSFALAALITGFYIGGHFSISGIPLLILLLAWSGFPGLHSKKI
jgi:hypothetical protein